MMFGKKIYYAKDNWYNLPIFRGGGRTPMRNKKDNIRSLPDPQNGYEICISCGNETDIKISTPVDQRVGYISGCGQMCKSCYEKASRTNSYGYSAEQLAYLRDLCLRDDKK